MARRRALSMSLPLLATLLTGLLLAQERDISKAEADRIIEALDIESGDEVADIGAGYGGWTVELARRVSDSGQVLSTEVDGERLKDIRDKVTDAGLANVSVIWSSQKDTGLPPGCCDAILLRRVYHHFTEPAAMRASISRALKANGLLAVIDFEPKSLTWLNRPDGVPKNRGGHGIPKGLLVEEMRQAGFEVVREERSWHGRDYCIVFRTNRSFDSGPQP